MANDYVQIPPDSTGKKIKHSHRLDIQVTNVLAAFEFERGDVVTGGTSGATADFLDSHVELGEVFVYVKPGIGEFQVGEQIFIDGVDVATIDNFSEQYQPIISVSDPNNSHHRLAIDNGGSAFVRYSEGDLGFDAFGHAQFSQVTQLQSHTFLYLDNPTKYWDQTANGGTISHVPSQSCLLLSVNDQSGSKSSRTTNQYYPYVPGEGNEILMSVRKGDDSKEGLLRRWGVFDNEDGIFFEQSGSVKSVVLRSSAGGTVTEEKVAQSDVNGDPLNSVNVSHYILDSTKYNLYWFDYQWLGVGRVRMGTFAPDGKRITIHTFRNPNTKTLPWAKRGTLPLRIEQENFADTSGTSELRLVCMSVSRQTNHVEFPGNVISYNSQRTEISGSTFTPLLTARPNTTHGGLTNRITVIPTDLELVVEGDPIRLDVYADASLVGSTYSAPTSPLSSVDVDLDATSLSGGFRFESLMYGSGVSHRELEENLDFALGLGADGVTQPTMTFSAKTIDPNGSANVTLLVRWKEVH